MLKIIGVRALAALILFQMLCIGAFSQRFTSIDPSPCFAQILQNHAIEKWNDTLRYTYQAIWSKDLYEAAKSGGQLAVILPNGVPIGASYDEGKTTILKELTENNISIETTNQGALETLRLDPQAGPIISKCLDAIGRNQFGLRYVTYYQSEKRVDLQFIWNWAPPDTSLVMRTLRIENAEVLPENNTTKHPDELLPYRLGIAGLDRLFPPTMNSPTYLVSLLRHDPDKEIRIAVKTEPDIGVEPIVIPPLAKRTSCHFENDKANPVTKTPYTYVTPWIVESQQPVDSIWGGSHHNWHWDLDIASLPDGKDGIIDSIRCEKNPGIPSDYADLDLADPPYNMNARGTRISDTVARCSGWWQNDGREVHMIVTWFKVTRVCVDLPWPKTTEMHP